MQKSNLVLPQEGREASLSEQQNIIGGSWYTEVVQTINYLGNHTRGFTPSHGATITVESPDQSISLQQMFAGTPLSRLMPPENLGSVQKLNIYTAARGRIDAPGVLNIRADRAAGVVSRGDTFMWITR
ncbi:MAG: hypothetical protein FWB72_00130 [Firmicutes bacterium]|nr:hypothetical protein [Bacillota bacterium]